MSRHLRLQWAYAIVVAAVAGALLAMRIGADPAFPAWWLIAGWTCFGLFVIEWGFPAPYYGHLSLDRVAQIGGMLGFGVPGAALANAIASLVWPFLNRRYNQGSLQMAGIRGLHNAGMTVLMMLAADLAYRAVGGRTPLADFELRDLVAVAVLAITMQAVNIGMLAVSYLLDGRHPQQIFTRFDTLIDLAFAPIGVLTGALYALLPPEIFVGYLVMTMVMVLAFHGYAMSTASLKARLARLDTALRTGRSLSGANRLDELAKRIHRQCASLFEHASFHLVLDDPARGELDFRVHWRDGELQPRRHRPRGHGLFGWIVEAGEPVLVEDWRSAPAAILERAVIVGDEPRSLMAVPLRGDGEVLGVVALQSREPNAYSQEDLNLLGTLADEFAPAIANVRAFEQLDEYKQDLEQRVVERTAELERASAERETLLAELREKSLLLERQSKEDSLTGLANRRSLDERLDEELGRADRYDHPLALALADLDHFKVVNDTHGHAAGDEVLRQAAALLRRQCRAIDALARYGGEEFALVFPETDLAGALVVCEKIRAAFAAGPWDEVAPGCRVTISIGVFEWRRGMDANGLFERADALLYAAKRAGRDRVMG